MVQKANTRDKILQALKERDASDVFNKNLLSRLNRCKDFVGVQARYHVQCMATFYVNRMSDQVGSPELKIQKTSYNIAKITLKKTKVKVNFP